MLKGTTKDQGCYRKITTGQPFRFWRKAPEKDERIVYIVYKNGSFKSIQLYKLGSAVRPTKLNRAIICNYMGKLWPFKCQWFIKSFHMEKVYVSWSIHTFIKGSSLLPNLALLANVCLMSDATMCVWAPHLVWLYTPTTLLHLRLYSIYLTIFWKWAGGLNKYLNSSDDSNLAGVRVFGHCLSTYCFPLFSSLSSSSFSASPHSGTEFQNKRQIKISPFQTTS